jgi:trehalose 6-phosphate phosphatase
VTAAISVKEALERASEHLERRPLLVCTDFDGTLSTIVLDPWAAAILPLARTALRRLAGLPGVAVVVLSGRTAWDVAARVRVGNVTYLGNHGMERGYLARAGRPEALKVSVVGASDVEAALAARLADEVGARINEPWLIVERKPPTVAFHYRQAPDVAAAGRQVRALVDELDPANVLERFPGRRVLELRPPGAVAKGEAFKALLDELKPAGVFMLGDDVSDAQAFAVLRAEREAGLTDGVAVAIQARSEVPADVSANADLMLGSPHDAAKFLSALARRISLMNVFDYDEVDAGQSG